MFALRECCSRGTRRCRGCRCRAPAGRSIPTALRPRDHGSLGSEFGLPILITENGVADDHDELRPAFLLDHLHAVIDAIDAGVDVRGYLYWTAWDNFEWVEGYTKRFGLIAVDRETLERIPKPSAALFAEICRERERCPSRAVPARSATERCGQRAYEADAFAQRRHAHACLRTHVGGIRCSRCEPPMD